MAPWERLAVPVKNVLRKTGNDSSSGACATRTKSAKGAINFCREGCQISSNLVNATLYAHLATLSLFKVLGEMGKLPALRIALINLEYAFRSFIANDAAYGGKQSKHASIAVCFDLLCGRRQRWRGARC